MKILFGVFDWGLGHATRCIPLIEKLREEKHTVDIIATGRALQLLERHFGKKCTFFDVPSVYVPYTRTPFLTAAFAGAIPLMLYSLHRARQRSARIIRQGRYDKVISDCRYDVYDKPTNSYLVNHQLRFKTFFCARQLVEKWFAWQSRHYRSIIVPDFDENNLTGELSHDLCFYPASKIRYIGIVSQVRKIKCRKDVDCFVSISGPEPQRTVFERKVLSQIEQVPGTIVIAGGMPDKNVRQENGSVSFYGFLSAKEQERMMNRANLVITRSGYTTMMELCELGIRNALLIPTPGQTEQEYLAELYRKRGEFYSVRQSSLQIAQDMMCAKKMNGFSPPWKTKESVRRFIEVINE